MKTFLLRRVTILFLIFCDSYCEVSFEKNDTNLLGHPVINRNLGIDFSNGSLGMGLSLGIGVAISSKKKKNG